MLDKSPEEHDLWAEILNDVGTASTNKEKKCLLVLGDAFVGKTTLINRLIRSEGQTYVQKAGVGLEYSFLDIKDQFSDDVISRLSIWTLNGNEISLKYTLSEFHLTYTDKGWNGMIVLVVDFSQPWSIMERLEHWVSVLEDHLATIKIDESEKRDLCSKLTKSLQEYCLPGTDSNKDVLLPLTEGVLENNLGLPIAVVCTKVDSMSTLEKDLDYTDPHFDLIQWHLRKFCLKHGAALFYVNGKESANADYLYKYVVHKMYSLPFEVSPSVIDKDCLMVPAGWDTQQKISILNDTLRSFNLEDNLTTVLPKPLNRRGDNSSREVKAEDDQAFLTRMQSLLQNQRPAGPRTNKPVAANPAGRTALPTTPGGGAAGAGEKDGVLANFFNSLLNKTPSPGTGGARPSGATSSVAPRTVAPPSPRQAPVRPNVRPAGEPAKQPAPKPTPTKPK